MPSFLQLALVLAALLAAAKIAGHLSARVGMPSILGELLVGVLLGPSCFNLLRFAANGTQHSLSMLAQIGALLLMFIAGLETDVEAVKRASGTAFAVAVGGVVLPLAGGVILGRLFHLSWAASWFLGGALTATSVSISAQTLMEIGRMMTFEASTILGAAVIDDILGLFVLAVLSAGVAHESTGTGLTAWVQSHALGGSAGLPMQLLLLLLSMSAFLVLAWAFARWVLPGVLHIGRRLTSSHALSSWVLGLVFLYAAAAQWLGGMAGITGAYLLGFLLARSEVRQEIESSLHAIGYGLLIPLFFVSVGLLSDVRSLSGHWLLLTVLLLVAIAGKVVGCGLAATMCGTDRIPALRIGVGMVSRGEVGLIVVAMAQGLGIFNTAEAAMLMATVLVTTLITPLGLRVVFSLGTSPETTAPSDELYETEPAA